MLGSSVDSAFESVEANRWTPRRCLLVDRCRSLLKLRCGKTSVRGMSELLRAKFRIASKLPLENSPLARGDGPVGDWGLKGESSGESVALTLSCSFPVRISDGAAAVPRLLPKEPPLEDGTSGPEASSTAGGSSLKLSWLWGDIASSIRILRMPMASFPKLKNEKKYYSRLATITSE